ncbi:hypothetical protein I316_05661 [Kwoniella heveanensis BCC8398]|uniref:Two-component system sensor protein n=1 Tax=Kwoniella heveanensis BCC8398 TaxID=1296120 RepID=A0A1B9GNU0_9TREE|nr:hypothetical protein I316_05661 [Kwoniella heveanensis BCC8398]
MPDRAALDLSSLPTEYLESYPYPAFVLPVPIPPEDIYEDEDSENPTQRERAFTRTEHDAFPPLSVVWSNTKWKNLTQRQPLLECLSIKEARKLGYWLTESLDRTKGTSQVERRLSRVMLDGRSKNLSDYSISGGPSTAQTPEFGKGDKAPSQATPDPLSPTDTPSASFPPPPPPDFWEPERPYEDRSSRSDTGISEAGADEADMPHAGPSTIIIKLTQPAKVLLEFTKTTLPIWKQSPKGSNSKAYMSTHTFAIITTTPKSALIPSSPLGEGRASPAPPFKHLARDHTDVSQLAPPDRREESDVSPTPRTTILDHSASSSSNPLTRIPLPSSSADPRLTTMRDPRVEHNLEFFSGGAEVSRPLMFDRDGTVSRRPMPTGPPSADVHALMASTDWSKTPLGPRDQWPQSLKTTVGLLLKYPHQCCLWWGKELTLIYNEAYAQMMHKHPHIFGMSGSVAWAEIWSSLGPLAELVLSGTPVSKEDDFLLFKQLPHQGGGTLEEYHTWMWVPVLQEDGTFGGLWNATIATTKKVLVERRMATVREMGQRTSIARTMREFDDAVIEILTANPRDVPFAALYHVKSATSEYHYCKLEAKLAGAVGIPDSHRSTPNLLTMTIRQRLRSTSTIPRASRSPTLSVMSSISGPPISPLPLDEDGPQINMESWPIKEALTSNRLVLVEDCSSMIEGYSIRVWDELPTAAVVVPITNESDDGVPSAVLVLGLNIRRPFDDDYDDHFDRLMISWVCRLRLQLASGIAAVRSYEAERQRIEELATLDRAKSLLFSNVSHELRTPLTLIAGPLDDLLRETSDGPRKETLIMARRNVRRLSRLVSTLMDVSRLEAGRLKGSFRSVNLGLMTKDLATLFRSAIEKAKLQYTIDCDVRAHNVYVDLEHWEKIVFNLIGNAMKYTMEGSVHVTLRYEAGEAVFAVKDTGVGIPASDIHLIGERFHRVQSVSRSHEGTGIGLALIKELIKLHGGTMSIESTTAEESIDGAHGSTFIVKIPLGSNHLPPDALESGPMTRSTQATYGQGMVDEAMQWTRNRISSNESNSDETGSDLTVGETNSSGSRSLDPATLYFKKEDVIMLVDDSYDTRRYMRSVFTPYCTVVEACDGLQALGLCKKKAPDLIISDVMMPNLDGYGLLAGLKEWKSTSLIPIIMLTARGGDEATVDGLLAGADDYLAKPFNARELIARAHMQLQLGKKRRALEAAFDERTMELSALTEYSPVGIFRADEDGNVVFTNGAWHEMSGYPVDQPVDRWIDYIHEGHKASLNEFWDQMVQGVEDVISRAHDYQFTNGRWAQLKAIRLDRVAPGMKGILGCVVDITERKINEESQRLRVIEAEQRRRDAEEAKRQQELLIDITSHEIRNPISSLMQMSSLVLRYREVIRIVKLTCLDLYCSSLVKTNLISLQEQLELVMQNKTTFTPTKQLLNNIEEDLDALESIYQCGLAQERISNDVLSLGKIQLEMFDCEVDMMREAQKVLSIFQNEARMKRIALSLKLGDGVEKLGLARVKTDPVRLNQIVTNLLSNAIRFTSTSEIRQIVLNFDISFDPPGENGCVMPRKPTLPASLADDMPIYLYFAVTDTGPGMTEAELEMLFQRFSQVSLKTHTIFGGSGLGLFVCRRHLTDDQFAHVVGGKIDVISQKGHGSTFRFYIKARTCQTAARVENGLALPKSKIKSTRVDIPRFAGVGRKPHVLIVEDNIINQTVLSRQLRHCNVTCDVASNGLEALDKIRAVSSLETPLAGQSFDCILMDLEMPGKSL